MVARLAKAGREESPSSTGRDASQQLVGVTPRKVPQRADRLVASKGAAR